MRLKLFPPRLALAFAAAAAAAVGGGLLSSRLLEAPVADAKALAAGWQSAAALERARTVLVGAELACAAAPRAAAPERCAAAGEALEPALESLRAATAGREAEDPARRVEAAVRVAVRAQVAGDGPWLPPEALHERAEAALVAARRDETRALDLLERAAVRSASLARAVVIGTDAALVLLVVVAAAAVRGHLRERQRRDEEHARVLELQQQLLGIVGHDLRTPLTAIAGSAALLARATDLSSSRARLAQRIVTSAGRMSRLIRDLLDFTRVREGGGLPVQPAPVNLGELCRRVALEVTAARPGAEVRCETEGDVTGEWDPDRLEQVVSNLLTNACHHGAHDRPVLLRVTGLDHEVRLAVHNDGPPIPPELLPHVFEAFRRGADDAQPGLGLGLHIVRSIVEAHGGTVEVRSAEGEGTTFSVTLPAPVQGSDGTSRVAAR